MNINYQEAYMALQKTLKDLYEDSEAQIIANWAMDHIVGTQSYMWKIQKAKEQMSEKDLNLYHEIHQKLADAMPIQYVIGEVLFYGSKFKVNENVLIPRPETEELIDWVISDLHEGEMNSPKKIVDLGTGAGIIPIILKKMFPSYEVVAYDIDEKALEVARENAKINEVEVEFKKGDILDIDFWEKELGEIDILISNPPYALDVEKKEMEQHVLKYEPLHAIFVSGKDPLQFYKAIEEIGKRVMKKDALGYLELSSFFAEDTRDYYAEKDWEVILRRDALGRNRMLKFE